MNKFIILIIVLFLNTSVFSQKYVYEKPFSILIPEINVNINQAGFNDIPYSRSPNYSIFVSPFYGISVGVSVKTNVRKHFWLESKLMLVNENFSFVNEGNKQYIVTNRFGVSLGAILPVSRFSLSLGGMLMIGSGGLRVQPYIDIKFNFLKKMSLNFSYYIDYKNLFIEYYPEISNPNYGNEQYVDTDIIINRFEVGVNFEIFKSKETIKKYEFSKYKY